MAIEALPLFRLVRTLNPESVTLAVRNPFDPYMPDVPRPVSLGVKSDARRRGLVVGVIEQLQPDPGGMSAEEGEVGATLTVMCSEG